MKIIQKMPTLFRNSQRIPHDLPRGRLFECGDNKNCLYRDGGDRLKQMVVKLGRITFRKAVDRPGALF